MWYLSLVVPTPLEHLRSLVQSLLEGAGNRHGSKKQAAELLGLHQSTLTRLVQGSTSTVSDRVIESICQRTGIRPEYFYDNPDGRPATDFVDTASVDDDWIPRHRLRNAALRLLGRIAEAGDQAAGTAQPEDVATAIRAIFEHAPNHVRLALAAALALPEEWREAASQVEEPPTAAELGIAMVGAAEKGGLASLDEVQRNSLLVELLVAAESGREKV